MDFSLSSYFLAVLTAYPKTIAPHIDVGFERTNEFFTRHPAFIFELFIDLGYDKSAIPAIPDSQDGASDTTIMERNNKC